MIRKSKPTQPLPQPKRPLRTGYPLGLIALVLVFTLGACGGGAATESHISPALTPRCVHSTLELGTTSLPFQTINLAEDGALPSLDSLSSPAAWVSNTFAPYIFLVKAGAGNFQSALSSGDPMLVKLADCSQDEFEFAQVEPGEADILALLVQPGPGFVVIVLKDDGAQAYRLLGRRPVVAEPATPEPVDPGAILADVAFSEVRVAEDGKSFEIDLTITNTGSATITLNEGDLSLTAEGQKSLDPLSVESALPQAIQPGGSLEMTVTFPYPADKSYMLNVFDTLVELLFILP